MEPRERLIVALDVSTAAAARKIAAAVGESASTYKVGMQLFTAEGPAVVRELVASGRRVFLDLKYHDIPNTVAGAVREAAQLGVKQFPGHARLQPTAKLADGGFSAPAHGLGLCFQRAFQYPNQVIQRVDVALLLVFLECAQLAQAHG